MSSWSLGVLAQRVAVPDLKVGYRACDRIGVCVAREQAASGEAVTQLLCEEVIASLADMILHDYQ
jgi:hypothetical protein